MTDDISKVTPVPNWCPKCGARQLAEAERQNKIMREADYHAAGVEQEQEIIELKSQLAEATRRLREWQDWLYR